MKPKTVYGAAINLTGLWGPYKMKLHGDLDEYYDKSGNFCVNKIGEHQPCSGVITFASIDPKEVRLWVKGVKATMRMLKNWCNS